MRSLSFQTTSRLVMVRPARFGFNDETAGSNEFQKSDNRRSAEEVSQQALIEFDAMVAVLRRAGVSVSVYEDSIDPLTPDALFPNNWISLHQSGKVVIYPMMAPNRRMERRYDLIDDLRKTHSFSEVIDLTRYENDAKFLEGTGSMVFDRPNRIAYACSSPRTHVEVLQAFAEATGYRIVIFHAVGTSRIPVYHTNVLMCIGEKFAVICLEAISDMKEKRALLRVLENTGKKIVEISLQQVNCFAGNMLEVKNDNGNPILLLSSRAFHSLTELQRENIKQFTILLPVDIPTIEMNGGGSARCMVVENHLPPLAKPTAK